MEAASSRCLRLWSARLSLQVSKYEILDMVCAIKIFGGINEDNKQMLQSDACELHFQHTGNVKLSQNKKETKRVGEESEG